MTFHCPESENRDIHQRHIAITTKECGPGLLLVTGELKEDRLVPYAGVDGGSRPPHTVHHMIVRIRVDAASLTIEHIDAEMPATPHRACPETGATVKALEGWQVAPGFSRRVKRALGGARGCSHLTALLLAMAPAVVQGFWVHRRRESGGAAVPEELLERYLLDTCRVWRRDGPLARKVQSL
jgi:hypothetical protein